MESSFKKQGRARPRLHGFEIQSFIMKSLEISPDEFRRLAEKVTQLTADYLRELDSRPIFPSTTGEESERLFHTPLDEKGVGAEALEGLQDVIKHSRAQNARFFGYVLGSGEPVAAVADLLASVLNQNVTAWRSGPAAITIEHTVIGWLAQAIGCPAFRGSLTGGGSSANLMALAMAREAKMTANEAGMRSAPQGVVYASEEVHMSIPKSVVLLGIGRKNLKLIPTDQDFRMIPAELEQAIEQDKKEGKIPIAVVASAGTVNTGTIDPLPEIAAIARRHRLWIHIDGAYGALAAIATPKKFTGLDLADSLSLDPHKWLYQPLDCGCLLYRDMNAAHAAFAHTGEYAKTLTDDPVEGFAFFEESLELSRRFRALRLWLSLRYHGLKAFRAAIQKDLDLAQRLASAIANQPRLELMAPVELSAICFRHVGINPPAEEELNRHNAAILKRVVQRGQVYLSNRTTEADVDKVITEVLTAAQDPQLR
jgi:glutamate/tyrosine decarboxylase-like PLP-dependent enzyme